MKVYETSRYEVTMMTICGQARYLVKLKNEVGVKQIVGEYTKAKEWADYYEANF